MVKDDKLIISFGMLGVTRFMVSFKNGEFILNESALKDAFDKLSFAGTNATRIFPWDVFGDHPDGKAGQFQPFILNGVAWDLTQWNNYYFPIMKRICEIANFYNITVVFCWFENCSLSEAKWRQWTPWCANLQGVQDFYDPNGDAFTSAWINRCIDELGRFDIMWSFGNELAECSPDLYSRVIKPIIKNRGLDFNRMLYGACLVPMHYNGPTAEPRYTYKSFPQDVIKGRVDTDFGEPAKLAMYKEVHSCGGPAPDADRPFGELYDLCFTWWHTYLIRKVICDDGVWNGDSLEDIDVPTGQARPSAERWYQMVAHALANYESNNFAINFEHDPKAVEDYDVQAKTMDAISRAYRDKFGVWPKNYGTHVIEYVDVQVCEMTGLLPNNPYCPKVVVKTFVKGQEPTSICAVHKKPDCKCRYYLPWNLIGFIRCYFFHGDPKCK